MKENDIAITFANNCKVEDIKTGRGFYCPTLQLLLFTSTKNSKPIPFKFLNFIGESFPSPNFLNGFKVCANIYPVFNVLQEATNLFNLLVQQVIAMVQIAAMATA